MRRRDYLGSLELIVLLTVMRTGRRASGFPIAREIQVAGGRTVALGGICTTLSRLEQNGLLRSELGQPTTQRGGRAKTFFSLTDQGLQEVSEIQVALTNLWDGLPELKS